MKNFDFQSDIDKCFIDPDDIQVVQEWDTRLKVNSDIRIRKLNAKKKKSITKKLENQNTNELFWVDKNELETARRIIGFTDIILTVRNCLSCCVKFESEGKHNRMCDGCRIEK